MAVSDTIIDILRSYYSGTAPSQASAVRIDGVGGGVSYIGKAATGSATSSAVWQVQKITETGPDTTIQWADGNNSFDNIWDNRLSLSYS